MRHDLRTLLKKKMYTTIISVSDLAQHINEKHWLIVDCRFSLNDTNYGRDAFAASHIPNAIYAHLDDDLSGEIIPGKTGRHPLPTLAETSALFSSWGIDANTQVVAYDDKGGAIASRLWWMLQWLGHEKVAVLNGGWQAWQQEDHSTSTETTERTPSQFEAKPKMHFIVDADTVDQIRQDESYVLIDSRAATRYRGEQEPIDPIAGHIPGAHNAPFADNLTADKTFKSAEELRNRFRTIIGEKGVDRNTVFYCGSGVTACHNILAFRHAGLGDPKLYPGSWSDWITNPDRPVAKN